MPPTAGVGAAGGGARPPSPRVEEEEEEETEWGEMEEGGGGSMVGEWTPMDGGGWDADDSWLARSDTETGGCAKTAGGGSILDPQPYTLNPKS